MQTQPLLLQSREKWSVNGSSRIIPPEQTLRMAMSLSKQIGVTRVADITHLDKLTIPNYSAVLPGTEDYIWVYSGKGPTKAHAKASALMECIERYSSLPSRYSARFHSGKLRSIIAEIHGPPSRRGCRTFQFSIPKLHDDGFPS